MESLISFSYLMKNVIVTTTLHDPKANMKDMILKYGKIAKEGCPHLFLIVSDTTSPKIIELVQECVDEVQICYSKRIRDTYINALKLACGKAADTDKILYADYDRLLHWVSTYPDEFRQIIKEYPDVDFYHIGRTKRAFETHPETQKKTEILANELGSVLLGFTETHDMLSACYGFTKHLIEQILSVDLKTELGFYAIWSFSAYRFAKQWKYKEVEGQEWETPDRFQQAIKEKGYEAWLAEFQTTNEWKRRVELLADCLHELYYTNPRPQN
jgi:hypothetical protein